MESRKVIGKPIKRVDGPPKAAGRAKYSSDFNTRGLLFAAYLHSPHAYAKLDSIDTSEAEKVRSARAESLSRSALSDGELARDGTLPEGGTVESSGNIR
jgi:CO/xanthine dehydrogenase Mo-binding subunit